MFITLDANLPRVLKEREEYAAFMSKPLEERAESRKELAANNPGLGADTGHFSRISLAEGKFIDLAIHKDTFLDDAALRSDVDASTPIAWKSRYAPTMGVTTGSVYGHAPQHLYQTQDNAAFLTPFVVDVEETKVPTMALTQDPEKLGQRQAQLERQAEALRLKMEQFLVNVMTGQPLGTDLAKSVYNYITTISNPYAGKTVYVVDPGVETGTYETSNIISNTAEGGLTPAVFDSIITQEMLSGRQVRTIHVPKRGLPWKQLIKFATVVANASVFSAGNPSNAALQSVPASDWEKIWKTDLAKALDGGLIIEVFGRTFKIKANNALPKGCAILTTDEPAAEVFNVTDRSFSYDVNDPREPFFVSHGEKRMLAMAQPDPWVRNWFALAFDTPAL